MFEGFIFGMLLWAGPAVVVWLFVGPLKLADRLRHHH